ncbi:MAG TPA: hypothetical protein VFB54_20610 [Burkholderiales bacterium]|nr:hypothetical protein [Burkholderiales bacterium]
MVNSYGLLSALEKYLQQRGVSVEHLTVDPMVMLMFDWFRLVPVDKLEQRASADVLVYRYGGWSEGCATGFRLSLLRKITEPGAEGSATDWYAGITVMFEPSKLAELPAYSVTSADFKSLDAFLQAIESSPAYKQLVSATPMSVGLESGGLR